MVLILFEYDDIDFFIWNIFFSFDVVSYILDFFNNIIFWGGNVVDFEVY